MTLPRFLIIGAQRSGTTSLRVYLSSHPDVFMPSRETAFFSQYYDEGVSWYSDHFPDNDPRLLGEKCAGYLSDPNAPSRIIKHMPDARFIVLLRDPVDRAWSHYLWARSLGEESANFEKAIFQGGDYGRKYGQHTNYLNRGHYAEQLALWFNVFPPDVFLIIKSEELFASPTTAYEQVLSFLELPGHGIDESRHGAVPAREIMGYNTRRWLMNHYKPHNRRLEHLLGRKLGWDDQVP